MMPAMYFDPQRLPALLAGAAEAARAAGAAIMQVYAGDFAVQSKPDHSPITAADLAAQQVIAAQLAALAPDIPLLAEESAAHEVAARRDWRTLWLVDPLDGTREFVKRNGEFAVNIALVHEHAAVLGVIYVPASDTLYSAHAGAPAWRQDARGVTRLQAAVPALRPPRVLASRSHRGKSLDGLLQRLGEHTIVSAGSSLKFGALAAGDADLYPRFSPTSEWDTAAGQAIVEAAGGCVLDLGGRPLRYNARDTLTNPSFMAFADRAIDWLALAGTPRD